MWKLFELLFHIQNKKSERLNLFNSKKNITENPLMLKYDNKQNQQNTYSLEARSSSARRAIRFESHSPKLACLAPLATFADSHKRARSWNKKTKQKTTLPLAILTEVFLPTSSACLWLPNIPSYKKRDFIFDSMPRGCQATTIHRMHRRTWRKWKRRCLATATHQRSLLWLEAPIGYHSVRLVLRVLPSASHSPTIGFCVESQCILRWVK